MCTFHFSKCSSADRSVPSHFSWTRSTEVYLPFFKVYRRGRQCTTPAMDAIIVQTEKCTSISRTVAHGGGTAASHGNLGAWGIADSVRTASVRCWLRGAFSRRICRPRGYVPHFPYLLLPRVRHAVSGVPRALPPIFDQAGSGPNCSSHFSAASGRPCALPHGFSKVIADLWSGECTSRAGGRSATSRVYATRRCSASTTIRRVCSRRSMSASCGGPVFQQGGRIAVDNRPADADALVVVQASRSSATR